MQKLKKRGAKRLSANPHKPHKGKANKRDASKLRVSGSVAKKAGSPKASQPELKTKLKSKAWQGPKADKAGKNANELSNKLNAKRDKATNKASRATKLVKAIRPAKSRSHKIAFFEASKQEKKFFKKALKGYNVVFYNCAVDELPKSELEKITILSVFIYSRLAKNTLRKMKKLELIATRSTGFDHIDIDAAKKLKIAVSNVPSYGENTVAEHSFALILALSRNLHKAYIRTLREDYSITGLEGFDLKGKTLGVVGTGHIGLHVIRIAKGFGMNVVAFDMHKNKFISEVLGFSYVGFDELLKQSDIITLHVPYNSSTHHLINRDNISLIKKGAILINTSRGAVVETEAIIEALDKKILAGAGLDVLEGEKLIMEEKQLLYEDKNLEKLGELVKDHILLSKENVVFTPHIAFYSSEALMRIAQTTAENIIAYINGRKINSVV